MGGNVIFNGGHARVSAEYRWPLFSFLTFNYYVMHKTLSQGERQASDYCRRNEALDPTWQRCHVVLAVTKAGMSSQDSGKGGRGRGTRAGRDRRVSV